MRSAVHSRKAFFYKMKKKPPLQAILDDLMSYTSEQLADPSIGQPLWIREILVELHASNGVDPDELSEQRAQEIADAMEEASKVDVDPRKAKLEVRRWKGEPSFVGGGQGGQFTVEILPGDIFQVIPDLAIRISSSPIFINDFDWLAVFQNSENIGYMDREEFYEADQNRLNAKHALEGNLIVGDDVDQSAPEGKLTGINPNQIERLGVRKF